MDFKNKHLMQNLVYLCALHKLFWHLMIIAVKLSVIETLISLTGIRTKVDEPKAETFLLFTETTALSQ
jgi:hypothetical protein